MSRSEQKAATRARIVDLAAARLREEGLAGNAVHRLMRDAGLTHGGFYGHFASKEALDVAALDAAMAGHARLNAAIPDDLPRAERRKLVAARYLSRSHRDHPESGCPLAALLSEVPHGGAGFRAAFDGAFAAALLARQEAHVAPLDEDLALMALAIGGLALSRAVADPALSDAILEASRKASGVLADSYEEAEQ